MKKIRLLSAFLTVVMAMGMLSATPLTAEETDAASAIVPSVSEETGEPTINYIEGTYEDQRNIFKTPQDKLATMTKYLEQDHMSLYIEPVSGEVAYVNEKTGQILFSNPYDISTTSGADTVKEELLSQITIRYSDGASEMEMFSFVEACMRGQIKVKKIKGGVRVEYTMGREETRKLVPRMIPKDRYDEFIGGPLEASDVPDSVRARMGVYYELMDKGDPTLTEREVNEMLANYPVCEDMPVYVFDAGANETEINRVEGYIKRYCPEYTFEMMEEDHATTEYEGEDEAPALFRLALEYRLDENGALDVRLPANGIRFDESAYQLTYVSMLPWFGAGSSIWEGYTFIPDGSGAIVRFEDIGDRPLTISGKIYGSDYAYQQVTGQNKEILRMPVYGIVETDTFIPEVLTEEQLKQGMIARREPEGKISTGFVAIIEEGDSLADISTEHGGNLHDYNTVYTTFSPRPKDTYDLSESISVASSTSYTVVSDRKYTGSYRIKYIMLTDAEDAEAAGLENYYENSYVGMAKAYRDYLLNKGELTELTDVSEDLPLYIESFGAINTTEKILSIPVEVLKPLTTFDDLKDMYAKLSEANITNVNFKLTGFANDGMNDTSAHDVKFEKAVGGNKGFTSFVEYANENGIGVYPDFDFANVGQFKTFDGVSLKKHMIKTMDDRYTTKRVYDSTLQSFTEGSALAVSPAVYEYFFDNFEKDYSKLNPSGVSVSTLGTDLNSDFDEDEPYNREDTKKFTTDLLEDIEATYTNVMVDGGNMYSLKYADHVVNASLDSSRYSRASEAVPFTGMVLHGCVNFAGTAINMAGDTNYEVLKAIENGASLYFTLSAQNTSLLKEDEEFNKYYSVDFNIWYDSVVELYDKLNGAIGDLQDKQIVDHEFIIGERVPSAEEAEADKIAAEEAAIREEEEKKIAEEKALKAQLLAERLAALKGEKLETETDIPDSNMNTDSDDGYVYTKYTSDDGRIVKVTYEGGKVFILNYNNFEVTVEGIDEPIPALGFAVIE